MLQIGDAVLYGGIDELDLVFAQAQLCRNLAAEVGVEAVDDARHRVDLAEQRDRVAHADAQVAAGANLLHGRAAGEALTWGSFGFG